MTFSGILRFGVTFPAQWGAGSGSIFSLSQREDSFVVGSQERRDAVTENPPAVLPAWRAPAVSDRRLLSAPASGWQPSLRSPKFPMDSDSQNGLQTSRRVASTRSGRPAETFLIRGIRVRQSEAKRNWRERRFGPQAGRLDRPRGSTDRGIQRRSTTIKHDNLVEAIGTWTRSAQPFVQGRAIDTVS